jgi:hypothetical protein
MMMLSPQSMCLKLCQQLDGVVETTVRQTDLLLHENNTAKQRGNMSLEVFLKCIYVYLWYELNVFVWFSWFFISFTAINEYIYVCVCVSFVFICNKVGKFRKRSCDRQAFSSLHDTVDAF